MSSITIKTFLRKLNGDLKALRRRVEGTPDKLIKGFSFILAIRCLSFDYLGFETLPKIMSVGEDNFYNAEECLEVLLGLGGKLQKTCGNF